MQHITADTWLQLQAHTQKAEKLARLSVGFAVLLAVSRLQGLAAQPYQNCMVRFCAMQGSRPQHVIHSSVHTFTWHLSTP